MKSMVIGLGALFSKPSDAPKLHDEIGLRDWLVIELAKRLRIAPDRIDPDAAFADLGIDSLVAIRLSHELEKRLGTTLEPTLLWEHPNIATLARHLAVELGWSQR